MEAKQGWCPSIRPDWPTDGKMEVFGIVTGTVDEPQVQYIEPVPATPELLAKAEPLTPMEIFRFTTPCHKTDCSYWDNGCTVATKLAALTPAMTLPLPPCMIRPRCQWFKDAGPAVCTGCKRLASDRIVGAPETDETKIKMVP